MEEFLTAKEAAKMLKVDVHLIWRYIKEGKIPAIKPSKKFIRIPKKQFEEVLEKWKIETRKEKSKGGEK